MVFVLQQILFFFSCSYTLCSSIWNASSRISKLKLKPKEFWSKSKSKRKRGEESTEGERSVHAPEPSVQEEEFIAAGWAEFEAADIPEFEAPTTDHVPTTDHAPSTDHVPTVNKFSATGSAPSPPPRRTKEPRRQRLVNEGSPGARPWPQQITQGAKKKAWTFVVILSNSLSARSVHAQACAVCANLFK